MKKIKKLSLNKKKVAQLNDAQLESLVGGRGRGNCTCNCGSNSCNSCINCQTKSVVR